MSQIIRQFESCLQKAFESELTQWCEAIGSIQFLENENPQLVAFPQFKAVESTLNVEWKDQQLNKSRTPADLFGEVEVDMALAEEEDLEEFKESSEPDTGKSWSEDAILEPPRKLPGIKFTARKH